MSFDPEFKFETFEEYFGDADQVSRIINTCEVCEAKLIHTHLSDYKNLCIQENSRCPECGHGNRKKVHTLN